MRVKEVKFFEGKVGYLLITICIQEMKVNSFSNSLALWKIKGVGLRELPATGL